MGGWGLSASHYSCHIWLKDLVNVNDVVIVDFDYQLRNVFVYRMAYMMSLLEASFEMLIQDMKMHQTFLLVKVRER